MTQISVYLRRSNGIYTKLNINMNCPLTKFNQIVSHFLNLPLNKFILLHYGRSLKKQLYNQTLYQTDIYHNSILDVFEVNDQVPTQITILVKFQTNNYLLTIHTFQPFSRLRQNISTLINRSENSFHMLYNGNIIEKQAFTTPNDLLMKENDKIIVNEIVSFMDFNTFGNKIRMVESVASQSQKNQKIQEEKCSQFQNQFPFRFSNKKKNSCILSIEKGEEDHSLDGKKSAIQLVSRHLQIPQENHERSILDMKQAMSYGSLDSVKNEQFSIILQNSQKTKYYRFVCKSGCIGLNIYEKLGKLQKVSCDLIKIEELDGNEKIDDIVQWTGDFDTPSFVFKICQNS